MTLEGCLTTRKSVSGLITVWVCLCAFSLSSFSQIAVLSWGEVAEGEVPAQKDEEDCEEELEVLSSARRRLKKRCEAVLCKLLDSGNRPGQVTSFARYCLMVTGHRFANGLCAPLLV